MSNSYLYLNPGFYVLYYCGELSEYIHIISRSGEYHNCIKVIQSFENLNFIYGDEMEVFQTVIYSAKAVSKEVYKIKVNEMFQERLNNI